jgi:hypothetical protein
MNRLHQKYPNVGSATVTTTSAMIMPTTKVMTTSIELSRWATPLMESGVGIAPLWARLSSVPEPT